MALSKFKFMLDGIPVGYFEESDFPRLTGRYRYTPFRGPGHYVMHKQQSAGGRPRCYYDDGGVRVSFAVHNCPEYGVLELCDFESSSQNDAKPAA
jgi:hypothetical protein